MSTEVKVRRGRGLGKKPRHVLTSIRIPVYVLEYFKENFDNSTSKMREVLELYVTTKGEMYGKTISTSIPAQAPTSQSGGNSQSDREKQKDDLLATLAAEEITCEWCGLVIPEGAAWSPTKATPNSAR